MSSWRDVLAQVREAKGHSPRYDLRKYWRVLAYRRHQGEAEPLVRARAFEQVLASARIRAYPGEQVCGSLFTFLVDQLPTGVSKADLATAATEHDARGQRDFWAGFDHSLADYPTLLAGGIDGYLERVRQSSETHRAPEEIVFLESVRICLEALKGFIQRHAEEAVGRSEREMAERLMAVAGPAPTTLQEAMQLVWLTHMAFTSEGRYAMALGRVDQYLLPFYQRDLAAGRLDREEALDLFCHLWARMDELGEVTNVCIGGLTPEGGDGTNELSYLCLEATRLVRSPHANLSARFHDGSPESFHRACYEVIRTGIGFPAIFNDHVLVAGLVEIGVPPEVARDQCMVGCIETMLAGRQQAWSDSRFNAPLCLLKALARLREEPESSWDGLLACFREILAEDMAAHAAAINTHIARFPIERFPDPFLSALTRDCIGRARDINAGGAEFARFHGVAVMGLATLADSLAAVRKVVFEERHVDLGTLLAALEADFDGFEILRQMLLRRAPKYGNDDPYVDGIAAEIVAWVAEECLEHRTVDGGRFVAAMAANTSNIPAGMETGATPDGRQAGTPLSDAASPFFGRDEQGPTAFLRSVAVPDYRLVLTGSVINMKFEPEYFEGEAGAERFAAFTRFFVKHRIPELQFNFTGNRTLLAAQKEPEKHRDLVVRVSGFSAYFVALGPEIQNDVIRRRAHVAN